MSDELAHYGVKRRSGRYPWGSGENPEQHGSESFAGQYATLRAKGMSDVDIAKGMGMKTTELRSRLSIASNEKKKADQAEAQRLRDKGMSPSAIGRQMGRNESSIRSLLNPAVQQNTNSLKATSDLLKGFVAEKGILDISAGTETHMSISAGKLSTAADLLKAEGYRVDSVKVLQLGTGEYTKVKVLSPPNTSYGDIVRAAHSGNIGTVAAYSDDGGSHYTKIKPPVQVSSSRIAVRYGSEGGSGKDGVIEVRRNVGDVSLGASKYAQVRVAVDGTHYLKGMAMYADDLPKGVDIRFNTAKENTGNKLDALKELKDDPTSPFGAIIHQRTYTDKDGKEKLSALNIVNEEGDWGKWSKSLSSQVLSKQSPVLAKEQLDKKFQSMQDQLNEINSLTNPAVKKRLLQGLADDADSAAVHLKAAALPRQSSHVILPITGMKDTEVYAPNYKNGEKVVLIRHPHGGIFEIPELTVNNNHPGAKALIENAVDAIGISPATAARMSGADFDGDSVLVIPNNDKRIKTKSPIDTLKNFEPQKAYPYYEGMHVMSPDDKQHKMGDISNLITDMTIKYANDHEIARAVRHSMVVIDAEKHKLNYKQSYIDNGIAELKKKYQGKDDGKSGGSATLISRAKSELRLNKRKPRPVSEGGAIDPKTGRKMFVETGESFVNTKGETVKKTFKTTKLGEATDARKLSSGTPMEEIYADHSNKLKALANSARKTMITVPNIEQKKSATVVYKNEVASLHAKLNMAYRNKPLERQAQFLANAQYNLKRASNPDMDKDQLKKAKAIALNEARAKTGAQPQKIKFSPEEWDAIQAGAISNHKLTELLANADLDEVKKLATPHTGKVVTESVLARAKAMLANGNSKAAVAEALGISASTLNSALSPKED